MIDDEDEKTLIRLRSFERLQAGTADFGYCPTCEIYVPSILDLRCGNFHRVTDAEHYGEVKLKAIHPDDLHTFSSSEYKVKGWNSKNTKPRQNQNR